MPPQPGSPSAIFVPPPKNARLRRLWGKRSLRVVLIVPFVLQVLGAVGLVGYLSFKNGQKAVNDLAAQLQREVSDRVNQHLDSYLAAAYEVTEQNAFAITHGIIDPNDSEGLGRFFWKQMKLFKTIGYVIYATPSGDYIGTGYDLYPDRPQTDEVLPRRYGDKLNRTYNLDEQGNRIGIAEVIKYDYRSEDGYKAIVRAKGPAWVGPILWVESPDIISIGFGTSIYDKNNRLIALIGVDQRLSQISDFLKQIQVSPSAKIFILERNGLMIASSSSEPPYRLVKGIAERLKAIDSKDPLIQGTAAFLMKQFGDFKKIANRQQLDFQLKGQRQFVQVTPWRDQYGLDWLVVVAVPESDFMAQINANTRNTIVLCLIAFIVAIALGILTARRITRPIERITQASEDMADGSLEQAIEPGNIVELEKLSNSFNRMAGQLEDLITGLEDKVKERTAELADANAEISALNEQLQAENVRMAAELSVARKIQQMILPKDEELRQIQELDIVGLMKPADEVGGDYYDVLRHDGGIKIGIGDVTGHGLESGVMMLMTQTAIRVLLQHQETDSTKFFSTLNRVLYDNAQRTNSQKTLSLAMLDYQAGCIKLSGQHEEMIVVRSSGQIERINTDNLGFPLGLVTDIDEFIQQTQVQLQRGDGVVLYTDGIIEAKNSQRQEYGLERLCDVLSQHWQRSVDEIRQAVLADVLLHIGDSKILDDITLLILKQK
ncbi:SpoIIE family protein phosphatase [Trichocoleus sp. DQ-U1]|uniref:SpoIIE family protein phosphatase n=1 Tax=Trichocoleus sp. DQ-U1 TaxID=2933926 RepID=UPI003297F2E4